MSIKFFSTYINHLLSRSMISDLGGKMPRILFGKGHKLFRAELFSKGGIALEWEYFGKTFIHFWRKYFKWYVSWDQVWFLLVNMHVGVHAWTCELSARAWARKRKKLIMVIRKCCFNLWGMVLFLPHCYKKWKTAVLSQGEILSMVD